MSFAEQQSRAHRERQRRLGKAPSVRPAVSAVIAPPDPARLLPEPKATVVDARTRGEAVPKAAAESGSNAEWQIDPASRVRAVIRTVARYYSASVRDIVSHRRTRKLIRPRHVAMYLAHEPGGHSLAIIGSVLGRDHTTIMHACRRIARLREQDAELDREIRVLIDRITRETHE